MCHIIIFCVSLMFLMDNLPLAFNSPVRKDVLIEEIMNGKTATLTCHSNDKEHNFQLWILPNQDVIGPENDFNNTKYDYEVLKGTLTIRHVSTEDTGVYTCQSRGVRSGDIKVKDIEMSVLKDYVEVYETDPTVNHYRMIVVMACVFLIMGVIYYVYKIFKDKHRLPHYLEASDEEDSAEEVFTTPSTPKPTQTSAFIEKASTSGYEKLETEIK